MLCLILIGLPTFLVAFLPTYETAGLLGPILLTVLRLIKGFAVGGVPLRRKVAETPAFQEEQERNEAPRAPIVTSVQQNGADMLRIFCMSLMNSTRTCMSSRPATCR